VLKKALVGHALANQLNLCFLALSFFTRLPVPKGINYSPQKLHQAGQHFALIGWLLAALLGGVYLVIAPYIGTITSICLLVMLSLLLTGAMHEDGLADTCDGFWGGHTLARKLSIMKDSQIGTYGTCALICILLTKTVLLSALALNQQLNLALCIAYPLSRGLAISHVQHLAYARSDTHNSKSQPLANPMQPRALLWLVVTSTAGLWYLPFTSTMLILLSCLVLRLILKWWFSKHIGGYTGDCLGFAQQVQELLIYLLLLAIIQSHSGITSTGILAL
tara:strand:+ start:3761 stop:4591 length:831 start_codon:yes stop_codon:yes gene_type:complete